MVFYAPQLLWLLLIPALLLIRSLGQRVRDGAPAHPKILHAEANAHSLKLSPTSDLAAASGSGRASATRRAPRRGKGSAGLLALGLALGVVALARPQYGERELPVFEQSREVLIALDLSRSMLAEDIKPSRLARAKLLISSLLERLAGERVGLVLFSGTAFLQSPLSADYEILREFLPELGPDTLPEGGTNYRALLDTALQAFSDTPATDRFLIILSDGEATDESWSQALSSLQKRDVRIITLGIGTPAGAMIPDGASGLVKDERGAVVLSKLEPSTLQQLAQGTGGLYRDASSWLDLAALIHETVEQGQRGQFTDTRVQRLIDRYQWALAPALALLLLSFWRDFPVRPRPRQLRLQGGSHQVPPAPTATLALFAAVALASTGPSLPAQNSEAQNAEVQPSSTLGKIVSRLAAQRHAPSERDWAELARETITWGQALQSEKQAVPPGPIYDALQATELGEALAASNADWAQLRRELAALLPQPEQEQPQQDSQNGDDQQEQNPEQQKQDGQQGPKQDQDSQNQSNSQQDQSGQGERGEDGEDSQNGEGAKDQEQSSEPQSQNNGEEQGSKEQSKDDEASTSRQEKQSQTAFGDMEERSENPDEAPSPPQEQTQQVGGAQAKDAASAAAQDPALTVPLQKLQQIRDQDSPAQLFQLMQDGAPKDESRGPKKNW